MSLEAAFGDIVALHDRITSAPKGVAVLAGSGINVPRTSSARGVPGAEDIVATIREEFSSDPGQLARFDAALQRGANRYQSAFQHLQLTRSQDKANSIVRRAVLRAYRTQDQNSTLFNVTAETTVDEAMCRAAEQHIGGWGLQPAVAALGQLIHHFGSVFRPLVLTSNFDPLIELSIRRAGGVAFTTALQNDGTISQTDAGGCHVIHIHGDWFRSDTLHTPTQLTQKRPRLAAGLTRVLRETTLLVIGYGGWDDIFMQSLATAVEDSESKLNVLWAFYDDDPARVARQNSRLFETLSSGIGRGRVSFYIGINGHELFPRILRTLQSRVPVLTKLRENYDKALPCQVHATQTEPYMVTSRLTGAMTAIIHRVHYAMDTNAQYLSFYIPQVAAPDSVHHICGALLKRHRMFLEAEEKGGLQVIHHVPGQNPITLTDAKFSNLVYFYVEADLSDDEESDLGRFAKSLGVTVVIRGPRYIRSHLPELRDPESIADA